MKIDEVIILDYSILYFRLLTDVTTAFFSIARPTRKYRAVPTANNVSNRNIKVKILHKYFILLNIS